MRAEAKGRAALAGLGLLFLGPLALAWMLYGSGAWRPDGQVNHGRLVRPPVPTPEAAFELVSGGQTAQDFLRRHWTMLYLTENGCDEACLSSLVQMRQVRLSLGRYSERIERVLLVDGPAPDSGTRSRLAVEHPGLLVPVASGAAGRELVAALSAAGGAGRVFIVDPLGNLMLSYAPGSEPGDMKEDLKRLLSLSRIG